MSRVRTESSYGLQHSSPARPIQPILTILYDIMSIHTDTMLDSMYNHVWHIYYSIYQRLGRPGANASGAVALSRGGSREGGLAKGGLAKEGLAKGGLAKGGLAKGGLAKGGLAKEVSRGGSREGGSREGGLARRVSRRGISQLRGFAASHSFAAPFVFSGPSLPAQCYIYTIIYTCVH